MQSNKVCYKVSFYENFQRQSCSGTFAYPKAYKMSAVNVTLQPNSLKVTHPFNKGRFWRIFACSESAMRASKMFNYRKSTTSFPTSEGWIAYDTWLTLLPITAYITLTEWSSLLFSTTSDTRWCLKLWSTVHCPYTDGLHLVQKNCNINKTNNSDFMQCKYYQWPLNPMARVQSKSHMFSNNNVSVFSS